MMGLSALACHFAGDWILQSDSMAARKLDEWRVRAIHCAIYTAAFAPFVFLASWSGSQASIFAGLVYSTHFAIDTRRWYEPRPGFESRPIWFDQALHVITLGLSVAIVEVVV